MSREINRFDPVAFPHADRSVGDRLQHRDRIQTLDVDVAALAAELRGALRGEVRFDDGSRALYATDASNYRQVPIGVVIPRDADDVVAAVALARKHGAPILGRGAGTSLAGQCCNVAVVIDMSKYMHRVAELDPARRFARVEPGIVLDDLRREAEKHHLTFGPDPATHAQCTLGGMIGNNSCGVHSIMSGKTVDNIEELEVLTYDGVRMRVGATSEDELQSIVAAGGRRGEIYAGLRSIRDRHADRIRSRFPRIPRRVSGYNLDELLPENGFHVARALVGSESTCVLVLEAKTKLVHSPPSRALVVLGYPTVYDAADDVPRVLGFGPIGLEGFDDLLVRDQQHKGLNPKGIALLPPGGGWLLVEFGGESGDEAADKPRRLIAATPGPSSRFVVDAQEMRLMWAVRESGLGATAHVPGKPLMWEGWEDAAVAPENLGRYLRDLRKLLGHYGYGGDFYGHFGDGCVHTRTDFDMTSADGIAKFRAFIGEAADLVASYGGSFSGEHGDGQARAELLGKMFGPELVEAFREFRRLWDPDGKMNPGKVVEPYLIDENLRLGTAHDPWSPETHFSFLEDGGRFNHAVLRCVGVGRCRRLDGGTMCPSYQVTREEEHSTRGRARLLFELFKGEAIAPTWRNEAVKDALDLCIACKGCKGDCPTHVDMASWKAEFLSHYYEGRIRPVAAYSMGLIWWWSGMASAVPRLANAMMRLPFAGTLGGVSPHRRMPRFATRTFRQQFAARQGSKGGGRRVLLWPDTFNNHFLPDTAAAAVDVLERAGFDVVIPRQRVCCGRPLYDWGFLKRAKKVLRRTLDVLSPELEEGLPVIGLEPSCVSVFRDELPNLFPHDPAAQKLSSSVMMLSEFITRERDRFDLPRLQRKAVVQGHCHHKAVMRFDPEEAILHELGLDLTHPDSGCCGMAGAFGFEEKNYEISMKIGERVLLPLVRDSSADTLVIADGFSCREQIEQGTGRKTHHFAEVLRMAYERGSRQE